MEQQGQNVVSEEDQLHPGEIRWVRCKGYRCMGMQDKDGRWRSFITGVELTDVIEVFAE